MNNRFPWIFGFLPRSVRPRDMIWLTKSAKFQGLIRSITVTPKTNPAAVVLVAHFHDTAGYLRLIAEKLTDRMKVVTVMADELPATLSGLNLTATQSLQVIVGERHPLASKDQAIIDLLGEQQCRCELIYHVALEDAMIRAFAGEWVVSMLRNLGMAEDEMIESKMVTSRILAAQKKIAEESLGNYPAESADEWIEKNCPHLGRK